MSLLRHRISAIFSLAAIFVGLTIAGYAQSRDFSRETARQPVPWLRQSVIYELNTRTFSPTGNFQGIIDRLDHLQQLGVNVIWLMPIHPIGQEKKKGTIGSPYAVRDFYALNPDYGSPDDFKRLVREAHRRGLKVIIDIVANHTAWDSVMMKTPEFYTRDGAGKIVSPFDWSDVADLNYDNPQLRRYMIDMLKYWLREYDLDGFRCDVAGLVPTDFWEEARAELDRVKADILLLAEWNDPSLLVKSFDLDYAWPFYHTMADVVTGGKSATAIRDEWEAERAKFPRQSLHLRFSDNHDEKRAIARFGEKGALAASALMLTMDGVPLLFNGMEAGDVTESGAPALFEKLPVFWGSAERRPEFPRFYREMIALRRQSSALTAGETEWLRNTAEDRVVTYLRRSGEEEYLIAINFSNRSFTGSIEVPHGQAFEERTPAMAKRTHALPTLSLGAWEFRLFRRTLR